MCHGCLNPARTVHPPQLFAAARVFDSAVLDCFHQLMQTTAAASGGTATLTAQHLWTQIQLPLRVGGMGLRSVITSACSAYFAALASALPELAAELSGNARLSPAAASALLQQTAAFTELQGCWHFMQQQGVGTLPPAAARESAPPDSSPPPSTPSTQSTARQFTLRGPDVPGRFLTRAIAHSHKLIAHRAACSNHTSNSQQASTTTASSLIPQPFLDQEKLQRQATQEIEQIQLGRLQAALPPFHQARLTALAAPHAAAFLTASRH